MPFFSDIEDVVAASDHLSSADVLDGAWEHRKVAESYSSLVAARGLLHANKTPVRHYTTNPAFDLRLSRSEQRVPWWKRACACICLLLCACACLCICLCLCPSLSHVDVSSIVFDDAVHSPSGNKLVATFIQTTILCCTEGDGGLGRDIARCHLRRTTA